MGLWNDPSPRLWLPRLNSESRLHTYSRKPRITEVNTKFTRDLTNTCQMYKSAETHISIDISLNRTNSLHKKYSLLTYPISYLRLSQPCIFKYNTGDYYLHQNESTHFSQNISKCSTVIALRSTTTHLVLLEEPDWPPPLATRPLQYRDGQLGL